MLLELLKANRSYRRFRQEEAIPLRLLSDWIGNCRYCASARNLQPLKYIVCQSPQACQAVFPALSWAGYLKDWPGPEEGERPSAYIVQLIDKSLAENAACDAGIQLQTLLLSAVEQGYGGCIIKAFNQALLREALQLSGHLQPDHVLALGRPKETVAIEDLKGNDVKYWRTADQVHHVPKRRMEDLLIKIL